MELLQNTILGITLARLIIIGFVVLFTFSLNVIVRGVMNKIIKNSQKDLGSKKTGLTVLKHLLSAVIIVGGLTTAIMMIPTFEKLAISIFAGAGVLAIIIGFASQQAFSNIVSGIFIAIFKPFRIGDRVSFGTHVGIVEDITLRHTVIRSFENKRIIVPNSVISNEILENSNIEDPKICRMVDFGISYDSSIDKAMKIMRSEAEKHPLIYDNRSEEDKKNKKPIVAVRVVGFSDSSVNLRAWAWTQSPGDAFVLGTDLNKSIKERFDREGIEIPFPYRTIVYKKDKPKTKKSRKK